MKVYIIILLVAVSGASCRPQRSTMLQTAQQSRQQFQQRWLYQLDDSLSRRWHFYTDSPFVYYPDSVLMGSSGYIWSNEHRSRSSLRQMEQDSSLSGHHTSLVKQKEKDGKWYFGILLFVVFILILGRGILRC